MNRLMRDFVSEVRHGALTRAELLFVVVAVGISLWVVRCLFELI